jgi:hypothetical protein
MSKRFDVLSPRPKKDGGTFWHRVGTAFEGDKGIGIVFDSLPLPDAEGKVRVSLFEPREKNAGNAPSKPRQADLDDDVPFAPEMR